ncbi:hypothetical protein [Xanthomonas axonopodis]
MAYLVERNERFTPSRASQRVASIRVVGAFGAQFPGAGARLSPRPPSGTDEGVACGAQHDTDGLHGNIANNSALMFLQNANGTAERGRRVMQASVPLWRRLAGPARAGGWGGVPAG